MIRRPKRNGLAVDRPGATFVRRHMDAKRHSAPAPGTADEPADQRIYWFDCATADNISLFRAADFPAELGNHCPDKS